MIPYHGGPLGGREIDKSVFYTGRHALVSFSRTTDLPLVAECCQSFVLDNGAFAAWRTGEELDVGAVIEWYSHWVRHPRCDWVLIPDKIDGTEEDNDAMIQDFPSGLRGVPVWHMHESLERLERLCGEFDRVALGSSGEWSRPGNKPWWRRMSEAMGVACDSDGKPKAKLHGLRMLDPAIFHRLPLSSADSANAAINNGEARTYQAPTSPQRAVVIANRVEQHNSAAAWKPTGSILVRMTQQELFEAVE